MDTFQFILLSLIYHLLLYSTQLCLAEKVVKKQNHPFSWILHPQYFVHATVPTNTLTGSTIAPKELNIRICILECSETTYFFETQLGPVWNDLSEYGRIKVELIPFGRGSCVQRNGDYRCVCQHGPDECILNQLMSCTMRYIPDPKRHMPLVLCFQDKDNLENAEEECLTPGMSPAQRKRLIECASGKEGRRLLKASWDKTQQVKPAIQFFPWVMLDGKGSLFAQRILLRLICQKLDPLPDVCDGEQGFW